MGGTTINGFLEGFAVVSAAPLFGASAVSNWGIALVVGILRGLPFGLGLRSVPRIA